MSILYNYINFHIVVQNCYKTEYCLVLHARMREPSNWCLRADLWRPRSKTPLFLLEICTRLQQAVIFLCLHRVWQSEHKISAFRSVTHRGSVYVNGNPSWAPNPTWVRKMGTEIWGWNFRPAVGKAVFWKALRKMPSPCHCQSFCTTLHSEKAPVFHYRGPFSSHICDEGPIKIDSLSGRQPSTQLRLAPETWMATCVTAGCVKVFSVHLTDVICRSGPPGGESCNKTSLQCDTNFSLSVGNHRMDRGNSRIGVVQNKVYWSLGIQTLTLARLCTSWTRAHGCYTFVVTLVTRPGWARRGKARRGRSWQIGVLSGTRAKGPANTLVWVDSKPQHWGDRKYMYCPKYVLNPKETKFTRLFFLS